MRSAPRPVRSRTAWRANRNRADAGHDLAFGQVAVAHQPSAAFFGARLGVAIKERRHLRLDRPRQQGPGAAAQHLGQRIRKRRWLGKLQNVIVTHGVSLLRWRSGGSITPTIRRLNPSPPSPTSGHSSPLRHARRPPRGACGYAPPSRSGHPVRRRAARDRTASDIPSGQAIPPSPR